MILIAENEHDDQVLGGLTALLIDLGVETDSYLQEDALAVVFWSANDLELEADALTYMSKEDRVTFLLSTLSVPSVRVSTPTTRPMKV